MADDGGGPFSTETNNLIGLVGGSVVSFSLIPQVWKTARTCSTTDISYAWQFTYIVGLVGINYYAMMEGIWPVWVPCLLELSLIVALTIMKAFFESGGNDKKEDEAVAEPAGA